MPKLTSVILIVTPTVTVGQPLWVTLATGDMPEMKRIVKPTQFSSAAAVQSRQSSVLFYVRLAADPLSLYFGCRN